MGGFIDVLKKFTDEKFDGNGPGWKKAKWGDTMILCTQDEDNWYYRTGSAIYVQAKEGNHTPHCYECDSEILFKRTYNSVWFEEFPGPVGGGEVRLQHVPYCPECEKEPDTQGVIIE